MKICFFMDSINTLGGAQKCTITLANELVQEQYDVSIRCTVKTPEQEKVYHDVDKKINLKLIQVRRVGILIEEVIERYKLFMEKNYTTQGEAAKDLKISRSHLNKIINRRDNPSTTLLIRMEKIMEESYGE